MILQMLLDQHPTERFLFVIVLFCPPLKKYIYYIFILFVIFYYLETSVNNVIYIHLFYMC